MKNKLIKRIVSVLVCSLAISILAGCSEKESKDVEVNMNKDVTSEDRESSKQETIENKELDKEETGNGRLSSEAVPLFEQLYASDKDKDLKINFAKSSLSELDEALELIPENLKKVLVTSGKLITNEGPTYDYNFIASDKKVSGGKSNNFQLFGGGVMFNDSKDSLSVRYEWHLTFKLINETEISLSPESVQILKITAPELSVETIESSMKTSLSNKGRSQYLIEEKNRFVTVSANVYENSNTVSIFGETRKDY